MAEHTGNGNGTGTGNGNGNGTKMETNFGNEIFQMITTQTQPAGNVIISPLLLEATLALVYLGADGASAEQLASALQVKRFGTNTKMANYYALNLEIASSEADTRIQLCNKLLLDANYEIAEEFEKIAQKYFHTAMEKVDLKCGNADARAGAGAAAVAAKWKKHLSGAIANVITAYKGASIDESLLSQSLAESETASESESKSPVGGMILCSAVNFKNKWFLPFSAYRSGIYEFHMNGSEQRSVPMLFDDDMFVKFGEFRELDARAIELPYEHDDELAMLLVLPNQRDGLPALEQKLSEVNLLELEERMQMESVQVLLPKFQVNFECNLRTCLEKLGISSIFSKEANFKNLLNQNCKEPLQITDVLHIAAITVNESGSEPSTVVANKPIVISNSKDSRHKFFRADHPFFFAIRSRDVTFFMGHISQF